MHTPLSWINLYTDISDLIKKTEIKELAHIYSVHTAEIDAIHYFGQEKKVVVGKIISTKPHSDSDHLNVVQVDLGILGKTQIVCGASNVVEAKYVPVATVGAVLGEDFTIKQARLRGEESNGMICSFDELGFQDERAEGIIKLEEIFDIQYLEANLGKPFFDLEVTIPSINGEKASIKLSQIIFEIDNKFITNRPDLFSIEGNAREFGAIFDLSFTPYSKKFEFNQPRLNTCILSDKVLAYHLVRINGVSSGISPFAIQYLLHISGQNSKFDLVDMTNYIMTELGQPMHAFDADKLDGDVVVRQAVSGEKMLALNGEEYELNEKDIVIADSSKILAIAGIIGGQSSAISETTQNIVIESACFDATLVRLTAQKLGIRTDSSTRYEKSQDPLLTYKALSRALDFLDFIGKPGQIIGASEYLNKESLNNIEIELSNDFIDKKLGYKIDLKEKNRVLTKLGFEIITLSDELIKIKVPSWRASKDISIKEDIVEEIGRIFGYEKIPGIPVLGEFKPTKKNKELELKILTQDYFASKGFFELYNYSFSNESLDSKILLSDDKDVIKIINAYSTEFSIMRRKMLANILKKVQENSLKEDSFKFFEIAKVHHKISSELFEEKWMIAGIAYKSDFSTISDELNSYLSSTIGKNSYKIIQGLSSQDSEYSYMHPNKSGKIILNNGENFGVFGFINPIVSSNFELEDNLIYFELDFENVKNAYIDNKIIFEEISKYPSIDRELNFVMDEKTPVGEVIEKISKIDSLIKNVKIIDTYRSEEKLGIDKKSITFSILLQDTEKTITLDEAQIVQNKIIENLDKLGIELRK